MKKIFLALFIFLSYGSYAQLNYLLSSYSKPYVPVSGGISPSLSHPPSSNTPAAEWGSAMVPIGFNFRYDGRNYSQVAVNVNGYVSLSGIVPSENNLNVDQNSLAEGTAVEKSLPLIAPFWDDLGLHNEHNLVYKTTGFAPFRVFTIEWKNAYWNFNIPFYPDLPDPSTLLEKLSFQLRFYEFSNIIEFHYKDEGNEPLPSFYNADYNLFHPYGHGASIGMTTSYCNRDFLSVQSPTSNPNLNSLNENDFIQQKPTNNLVYRFIPAFVKNPLISRNKISYTNNSLSFNLDAGNTPGCTFEYAITHSDLPPASGQITGQKNITVSGLQAATVYYIHARTRRYGFFSQWSSDSVRTASAPQTVPYIENFDETPPGYDYQGFAFQPDNFRTQDFNDTLSGFSYNRYDPAAIGPFVYTGLNFLTYFQFNLSDANVWSFTPGINLKKGKRYKLSFRYTGIPFNYPDIPSRLEVKYGSATGFAGMNEGTLFVKNDILNPDFDISDTAVYFTASKNGNFYFGFHNTSTLFGAVLFLDDISITEDNGSQNLTLPITLSGKESAGGNRLSWTGTVNNKDVVIEAGADGVHFHTVGNIDGVKAKFGFRKKMRVPDGEAIKQIQQSMTTPKYELVKTNDGVEYMPATDQTTTTRVPAKEFFDAGFNNSYYRIKQVGANGKIRYSNILPIHTSSEANGLVVFPNPSQHDFHLNAASGKTYTAVVYDVKGRMIATYSPLKSNTSFGAELPKGSYLLKLQNGSEVIMKKIEKL